MIALGETDYEDGRWNELSQAGLAYHTPQSQ
jgi:hypothetical protein